MFFARSATRICSPMSRTNTSPPCPRTLACRTNWTDSGIVMKYRLISGCVTVIFTSIPSGQLPLSYRTIIMGLTGSPV